MRRSLQLAAGLALLLGVAFSPVWARHEPLYEPRFVPAARADFLRDTDRVVGVSGNGAAKAYAAPILYQHHVVHDRLGGLRILLALYRITGWIPALGDRIGGVPILASW